MILILWRLWDGAQEGVTPPPDPPPPVPQPTGGGGNTFVGGIFRTGTERYDEPARDLTKEWLAREREEHEARKIALMLQAKREDDEVATLFAALAHTGFFGRMN